MPEPVVRLWCAGIASKARCQVIERDGVPYLRRYFIAGWNPVTRHAGASLFLHHFVASDAFNQVHSHPWGWSASLILVGGYREHRCDGTGTLTAHEFKPGDVNVIAASDRHRIELLARDCWTLFLAGDVEQHWNFQDGCF